MQMGIEFRVVRAFSALSLLFAGSTAWADPEAPVDDNVVGSHANEATGSRGHVKALPCRPTIACTAEIVPAGAWEVEAGYSARNASGAMAHGGQLLLKYSVLDHLQLQLATNNVFSATPSTGSQSFFDGGFFGPKVQFNHQGDLMPMIAVSAFLGFPTHAGDVAIQQTYDAYVWSYFSKDISFVHTDLNLGVNILDLRGSPKTQEVTAWSFSSDIAYGLGVMTEGYGFFGGGATVADAGWLNAISYSPVPEVMFDLGGDVGIMQSQRAYTLFVGVTFVPYRLSPNSRAAQFAKPDAPPPSLAHAPQPNANEPSPVLALSPPS